MTNTLCSADSSDTATLMAKAETLFSYRAVHIDGTVTHGAVHASTREAAVSAIKSAGLFPINVRTVSQRRELHKSVRPADLALGLRVLSDLFDAGLPMARALAAFEDIAPKSWEPGLPRIRKTVREGRSLVAALQGSGLEFPQLVLGVIQAGETGGNLASAVRHAAEFTETSAATRNTIRSALVYPAILAFAGSMAIALLVGVVLPRFADILTDLGQALPTSTQLVMTAADFAHTSVFPIATALLIVATIWRLWTSTPAGRIQWHRWLLALPVIGPIRHKAGTAHASAALASLLESGVTLPFALIHSARATGDSAIEAAMLSARDRVLTGQRLAAAMADTQALTPTGIRLVRAGEDTGRLPGMLHHAAKIEGEQAQQAVKNAVQLLEPLLILIFGAIVAFVAAALLQAVYSVGPATPSPM